MISHINLLDFPDEILLIIFAKLKTIDVLYSLANVNRRLNELVCVSLESYQLDITRGTTHETVHKQVLQIDKQIFSRICQRIVSRIHRKLQMLAIDEYSIEEILLSVDYPHLNSLSLVNFRQDIFHRHLRDDLILRNLVKQITHLKIDIEGTTEDNSTTTEEIFPLILALCQKLIVLNLDGICSRRVHWNPFYIRIRSGMSSTLIHLQINLENFADCLYLLDGRLPCLSTLLIKISRINSRSVQGLDRQSGILQLKCFSLTVMRSTSEYDYLIVPLLCRMINLEQLTLSVSAIRVQTFYIDGIELYETFLIHLKQLKKFIFDVHSIVYRLNGEVELQSNESIARSFIGRGYQEVSSNARILVRPTLGRCHVYTLPFAFDNYMNFDGGYQGGIFHQVRILRMYDARPFECKQFQVISRDFPALQVLSISNSYPQEYEQDSLTILTFPCLTYLDVHYSINDYAAQFLLKKRACLPRLSDLPMNHESLITFTSNFTDDPERFNFDQLKSLHICQSFICPENFSRYFPFCEAFEDKFCSEE